MNEARSEIDAILTQINRVILGKDAQIRLCLTCLLARGHLLIEDIPGVGKTTLAHAIAKTLGLSFQRVQFTSDLLPADVLGVSIYDRETESSGFNAGRSLRNWCSPMRSTARLRRRKAHCSKPWKNIKSPSMGNRCPCPNPFSSSRLRIRRTKWGPFPCPNPSSIAS